jgi:hypothetical protein
MTTFSARHRGVAALLAVSLAIAPVAARAQQAAAVAPAPAPTADAVAQARQHFTRGVKLYEEDDFRTALIEFNRAYELAPNWQVLYNIGQSYYQLRDYADALATMERYVAEGGANVPRDRRAQVDKEMDELRGRVAHVTFTSNVEGADVAVDDVVLGKTPFTAPHVVSAGRHKMTASKAGWASAMKVVDVAGGDTMAISLDMTEQAHEQAAAAAAPAEAPSHTGAYVAGGIGIAGVVVGSIFGILAIGNKSTLKDECTSDKVCTHGSQSDIDAFSRNGAISTIGFAVGIVGLGTAAALFLTSGSTSAEPAPAPQQAAVRVTPWISPGGAGLVGTF